MTDTAERLLREARAKLVLYRAQHSGEYIGGKEYTTLIAEIDALLSPIESKESIGALYDDSTIKARESTAHSKSQLKRIKTQMGGNPRLDAESAARRAPALEAGVGTEAGTPLPTVAALPASQGIPEEPSLNCVSQQTWRDYGKALRSLCERQQERIRELEKDAARYRWLRERYSAADDNYKDFGEGQVGRPVIIFDSLPNWPFSFDYEKAAELLDAAIDAARTG